MTKYSLEIIAGTLEYVLQELKSKYADVKLIKKSEKEVVLESEIDNVDEFRELKSVLRITKDNGLTRNLFRRDWRKEYVPAGINPALAYVLCMTSDLREKQTVLDPFCGGGTIPISAKLYFPIKKAVAADLSGAAIDITTVNARAAGLNKHLLVAIRTNITALKLAPNSIDRIITNLPFGVRVGSHEQNEKIYDVFARKAYSMLKEDGIVTILTQEKLLVEKYFARGFKLVKQFTIAQGGLYPTVFVYCKRM